MANQGKGFGRDFQTGAGATGVQRVAVNDKNTIPYRPGGRGGKGKGGNAAGGPYAPGTPYYRGGNALATAEYGPTISQDRQDIGINNRQGAAAERLTEQYYKALGQFVNQSGAQEKQISGDLASQLAQLATQQNSQLAGINNDAIAELLRYTPGNGVPPMQPPSDTQTGDGGRGIHRLGGGGGGYHPGPGPVGGLGGNDRQGFTGGRGLGAGGDHPVFTGGQGLVGIPDRQRRTGGHGLGRVQDGQTGHLGRRFDVQDVAGGRGLRLLDRQAGAIQDLQGVRGDRQGFTGGKGLAVGAPPSGGVGLPGGNGGGGGIIRGGGPGYHPGGGHVGGLGGPPGGGYQPGGGKTPGPPPGPHPPPVDPEKMLGGAALQSLAQQLALTRSLGAENMNTFRAGGLEQGANYRGLAASNLGTYASAGQQQLGQIAQAARLANAPIEQQITALRAKEGALRVADIVKLRQQAITNNLTRQGLGLKNKALNVTAANDRARNALEARAQNIAAAWHQQEVKLGQGRLTEQKRNDLASQAAAAERNRISWYNAHHGGSGGGKAPALTPSEQLTAQSQFDSAVAALGQPIKHNGKTVGTVKVANVVLGMGPLTRTPQAIAEAAWEIKHFGGVNPNTANDLRRLGVSLNYRGKPIRVLKSIHQTVF